jgi:hypothetical protein
MPATAKTDYCELLGVPKRASTKDTDYCDSIVFG